MGGATFRARGTPGVARPASAAEPCVRQPGRPRCEFVGSSPASRCWAAAGEPFDLLITGSTAVDEWVRDGRVAAASRTDLARSGIGVAVRAGAPKSDVGSVDAFRRAVLNAPRRA